MTFLYSMVEYITTIWHEFVRYVTHEQKRGQTGFWHNLQTYLITIPLAGVLTTVALLTVFTGLMLMVPISKLFGYDLGDLFAKKQEKLQVKLKPGMAIPYIAKFHSASQKWSSISPASDVYKDILASVKKLEHRKDNGGEKYEIVQLLFWVPFPDYGSNKKRLDFVRSSLRTEPELRQDAGDASSGNVVNGKGVKSD